MKPTWMTQIRGTLLRNAVSDLGASNSNGTMLLASKGPVLLPQILLVLSRLPELQTLGPLDEPLSAVCSQLKLLVLPPHPRPPQPRNRMHPIRSQPYLSVQNKHSRVSLSPLNQVVPSSVLRTLVVARCLEGSKFGCPERISPQHSRSTLDSVPGLPQQ